MNAGKLLAIGAAIVAIAAVSISIWLDPPSENRARAMDAQRLARLNLISSQITLYFAKHKSLPGNLDALDAEKNQLSYQNWHDPETGQPFEYEITGEKGYRLCANFARASDAQKYYYGRKHNAGRDCLDYTVR